LLSYVVKPSKRTALRYPPYSGNVVENYIYRLSIRMRRSILVE